MSPTITLLKFFAAFLITWSHLDKCFPADQAVLATGGTLGNGLFFFISGFGLFLSTRNLKSFSWFQVKISKLLLPTFVFVLAKTIFNGYFDLKVEFNHTWFVWAILAFYVAYHPILIFFKEHIFKIILITYPVMFIIYAVILLNRQDYFVDIANYYFKCTYYFQIFLFGGWVASKNATMKYNFKKDLLLFFVFYGAFNVLKFYIKGHPSLYALQILSPLCIMPAIYYLFKVFDTGIASKIIHNKLLSPVVFVISGLTLEIYLVQFSIITKDFNSWYPWNIPLLLAAVLLSGYLLKIGTGLFKVIFFDGFSNFKSIWHISCDSSKYK